MWQCVAVHDGPGVRACVRARPRYEYTFALDGGVVAAVARRGVLSGTRSCAAEPEERQAVHRDKEDVLKKIGRRRQERE